MPLLKVHVDEEAVTLDVDEKDDLIAVACLLEESGYDINVATPEIYLDGEKISGWQRVDHQLDYHFCK